MTDPTADRGSPADAAAGSLLRRYAAAIGLVAAAGLARWAMAGWVGLDLTYLTFYPAVFLAAWWLGPGPTLLTVLLAAGTADYFLLPPLGHFSLTGTPVAIAGLAVFGGVGFGMTALSAAAERGRQRDRAQQARGRALAEAADRVAYEAREAAASAERLAAERADLAAELERERARLEAVLQQIPVGVVLRDAEGRLQGANTEAQRLLGGTVPELDLGAAIPFRFRQPDGAAVPYQDLPLARARRYGEVIRHQELLLERADGSTVWVSASGAPVSDSAGRTVAGVAVLVDLTRHREADAALRESQERLAFALDAGRMGTFDWLIPEGLVEWSRSLERLHGYPPGGFAGTAEAYFAEIHPDDRERVGELVQGVFAGTREHRMEYRIVRPDGVVLWVEGRGTLIRAADGSPLRLIGVCIDINERKLAEEAARHSQRLEAMGQLAAGIAHDTNNMMAAVLGYAHLLHRAPDVPLRHRADLQEIIRAAERSANLSQQLLAFSRRQLVAPEVLDVNAVVRETRDMLGRTMGPDVELELGLDGRECWISFDRTQLVQVLLNLALNARDAMPDGGRLELRTHHENGDTAVTAGTAGDDPGSVVIEVHDSGAGMDEATRLRIFEPFFTTKEAGKGTGLGLSTVYGIVTRAHGTIEVDSAPGEGSTFRIALPCVPAPAPSVTLDQPAARPSRGRTLLVDDEATVRILLARMLEEEGFAVDAVGSGEAALGVLRAGGAVDLLITDLTMPGMSGRELAVRVVEEWPELPILFITGHHGDALDDLTGPRAAVLQKPFSPDGLISAVTRLMGAV